MLPGKRDFYRCCKARRSASHVNKEFWQFQNYAPPSLRVIRTKFARTIILCIIGRAKRAPHWGVQSRFRVIYICMSVGMYVCLSWSKKRRRKYVGLTRACSKSVLCGKIRPVTPALLISTIRYSSFSMDGRETFTYK